MRLIHHENLLICMKGVGSNQMLLIIKDNNPPDPHRFHIPPSLTSCDNSSHPLLLTGLQKLTKHIQYYSTT